MSLLAGTAHLDIVPQLTRSFDRDLERQTLQPAERAGKRAGGRFGATFGAGMGGAFAGIRGQLLGIGALAGGGAALGLKSLTDSASDLNETISKGRNVFGENFAAIEKWSRGSAQAFGLSQQQALAATAQFGDMFIQLGFTGGQAAQTSTDLVKLAADLGSFHNVEPTDVLDRISGALRGEYDALQQLIPNISAARVEQEALAATGKTAASQLTAQEKATATLAIVQRDGANAANDFAETSGGLANKQRILNAEWQNAKARLGTDLMPLMTQFVSFLTDQAIPAVSSVWQWMKRNSDVLVPLAGYVGGVIIAVKAWTAAQWLLNAALTANPVGLVIAAVVGLGAALIIAWQRSETFRNVVTGAFNVVLGATQRLANVYMSSFEAMLGVAARAARALGMDGLAAKLEGAKGAVTGFQEHFNNRIDALKDRTVKIDVKTMTGFDNTSLGPGAQSKYDPRTRKASGGYISGPGTGTSDSIPALLSNGEYVIKASSVRKIGVGALHRLNAVGYATGGYVGDGAPPSKLDVNVNPGSLAAAFASVNSVIDRTASAAAKKAAAAQRARMAREAASMGGSTTGIVPELLRRFTAWSNWMRQNYGFGLGITSGFRSRASQEVLYARYLAGNGPIAARPGTSKHERGLAIDHNPKSWAWANTSKQFGLHHPVPSEAWHVEMFDRGGWLPPGDTLARNHTGRPEAVLRDPVDLIRDTMRAELGGGKTYSPTFVYQGREFTEQDYIRAQRKYDLMVAP